MDNRFLEVHLVAAGKPPGSIKPKLCAIRALQMKQYRMQVR